MACLVGVHFKTKANDKSVNFVQTVGRPFVPSLFSAYLLGLLGAGGGGSLKGRGLCNDDL